MATDAQKRASKRYNATNTKSFNLTLNKKNDADIIKFLDTLSNKSAYLKNLIRSDMYKNF